MRLCEWGLREEGLDGVTTLDKEQAHAAIDDGRPDVIIINTRLATEDGALLRALQAVSPATTAVITLASRADDPPVVDGVVLHPPHAVTDLVPLIQQAFSRRQPS